MFLDMKDEGINLRIFKTHLVKLKTKLDQRHTRVQVSVNMSKPITDGLLQAGMLIEIASTILPADGEELLENEPRHFWKKMARTVWFCMLWEKLCK